MRFYNQPHAFYCGVDLHARSMFTHVLDHAGATVFARDLVANPKIFLDAVVLRHLKMGRLLLPGQLEACVLE